MDVSINECEVSEMIIALEREALEKWNQGDPSGYLELYAEDFTYFDPYQEKRLDGLDAIRKLYNALEGQVKVNEYELISPKVQLTTDCAVLTFNLNAGAGDNVWKWNCTEVYCKQPDGKWKIIHNHWSLVQPT